MKILAACSPGGHETQLRMALGQLPKENIEWIVASKSRSSASLFLRDFSAKNFWHLIPNIFLAAQHIKSLKPDIVISTGAAPGLCVLWAAWLLGIRGIWIDSLANTQRLSLSGRLARPFAHLHLTQWPQLADSTTLYKGQVL